MKVVMVEEKRLDELFDTLKLQLEKDKFTRRDAQPGSDMEAVGWRTFIYHFEGLRAALKDGKTLT